jgi:hypothetical protein
MNEPTFKGCASEKLVEFDLLLQGIECLQPSRFASTFDLIAVVDGKFYTVQVKTGKEKGNSIIADIRKPSGKKRDTDTYYGDDIDVFAVVDIKRRKVAYFVNKNLHRQLSFQLSESKPRNQHKSKLFDDYTKFPIEDLAELRNKKAPVA